MIYFTTTIIMIILIIIIFIFIILVLGKVTNILYKEHFKEKFLSSFYNLQK